MERTVLLMTSSIFCSAADQLIVGRDNCLYPVHCLCSCECTQGAKGLAVCFGSSTKWSAQSAATGAGPPLATLGSDLLLTVAGGRGGLQADVSGGDVPPRPAGSRAASGSARTRPNMTQLTVTHKQSGRRISAQAQSNTIASAASPPTPSPRLPAGPETPGKEL